MSVCDSSPFECPRRNGTFILYILLSQVRPPKSPPLFFFSFFFSVSGSLFLSFQLLYIYFFLSFFPFVFLSFSFCLAHTFLQPIRSFSPPLVLLPGSSPLCKPNKNVRTAIHKGHKKRSPSPLSQRTYTQRHTPPHSKASSLADNPHSLGTLFLLLLFFFFLFPTLFSAFYTYVYRGPSHALIDVCLLPYSPLLDEQITLRTRAAWFLVFSCFVFFCFFFLLLLLFLFCSLCFLWWSPFSFSFSSFSLFLPRGHI